MQQPIELTRGGLTLRGTLHRPDGVDGPLPLVVIFHGFTADRNEARFVHTALSRQLCAAGIASVRFDFAGSGESDGSFDEMSLATELLDASAILDFVRGLDFVDPARIGLHGMSMGGAVASLLAGDRPDDVRALSLWAPAANLTDPVFIRRIMGDALDGALKAGYADLEGIRVGAMFVRDALSIDLYARAGRYTGPVQIIHGDADQTVPFSYSERYCAAYGGRASLIRVPGAGHNFGSLEYRRIRLDGAVDFLRAQLG